MYRFALNDGDMRSKVQLKPSGHFDMTSLVAKMTCKGNTTRRLFDR